MKYKELLLKEIDPRFKDESTSLRIYISSQNESVQLRPGMLVCPGGGYSFCSEREAEPVAYRFLSEGFNCFILNYTVNQKYPKPHLDLALVFAYIRKHEKEFDLLPNSLSLVGFSAGGHLVGSYGYLYKELAELLNEDECLLRPLSITMGYPVITLTKEYTHEGTRDIISNNEKELLDKLEIVNHVKADYPPTFIWTTLDDDLVPSKNTIMMEEALKRNNIKHHAIIFESGWHGSSIVNRSCSRAKEVTEKMLDIRDWASKASDFIFELLDK